MSKASLSRGKYASVNLWPLRMNSSEIAIKIKTLSSKKMNFKMSAKWWTCCVAHGGWRLGAFLRWWPPSAMWAGPLIFLWLPPGMSEKSHLFEFGLCAACWACFMCHHELWPTSVSHPFSFLNSSLGLAGGKHYQKIIIPILWLVLQNFAIPCYFPCILFYSYLSSLLSSGRFVVPVCGSVSVRELFKSYSCC